MTSSKKTISNCDVLFANGELYQAHGHVTLTMSAWPKYGHRSLVGYRLPRLCSYSWPPYVCRLIPWLVLFFDDFICLWSWYCTSRWHDFLLSHDLLWLTCWFLLPNLSNLPRLNTRATSRAKVKISTPEAKTKDLELQAKNTASWLRGYSRPRPWLRGSISAYFCHFCPWFFITFFSISWIVASWIDRSTCILA